MEYGFISLLPVLVILIIAVATKRTLFAMTFERSNAVTDFGIYFLRRLFEQFGSRYDDEGHYRQTGHSENTACLCRKRGRRAGLYSDPAFILGGIFRDADGKPRRCG